MKIGIIGAGFTGLSAAFRLTKAGHEVVVFEKDTEPGGLAVGYQEKGWDWTLEKHYHHWFTNTKNNINNDKAVFALAKDIGHNVIIKRPKTSIFVDGNIYQFDSPKEVLLFPKLSLFDRLRMGFAVALLRYNPFWKPLEKVNATTFLPKVMGEKAYSMIWKPQLVNKFGKFAENVSLAWVWARIISRTPKLGYPEGGYLAFAQHIVKIASEIGATFHFDTEVLEVNDNEKVTITYKQNGNHHSEDFDTVIFTTPSFLFLKLLPQLPETYREQFNQLNSLGATNLILRLKEPFLKDHTYWLSICDLSSPIMVIGEHTNFMDRKHYNNEHLVYLGNYMAATDKRFSLTKEETLALYDPFLKKINPDYKEHLIGYELFKAPFAQPIIPTNYSKMIPSMVTPLPHVFLANIDQVYPWDRGTSNAVALGEEVAKTVLS